MFAFDVDDDITLRPVARSDAQALFALFEANREHLEAWQDWPGRIQTLDDCRAYVARHVEEGAQGKALSCVIEVRGAIVGMCWLSNVVPPLRKAFLNYWIDAAHQGRGIVTRSCRGLMAHAFGPMQLNRLALQYKRASEDHENVRSRRVAERLGFTREGVLRQDGMTKGVLMDMVLYSLLAEEWRARRPTGAA